MNKISLFDLHVNGFGEKNNHGGQKGADYLYLSIFGMESAFSLLFIYTIRGPRTARSQTLLNHQRIRRHRYGSDSDPQFHQTADATIIIDCHMYGKIKWDMKPQECT